MKLNPRVFLWYKLLNSAFTGLSVGILFTIYQPLEPSIYSVGGIFLALAMLIVAKFYDRLLNIRKFFQISMVVEIVMLITIFTFLIFEYTYLSAIMIYVGYQFTFVFGGYLVRAETLVASRKKLLGFIDVNKQKGYLVGLLVSYIFYKFLESIGVNSSSEQIYVLHFLLLLLELIVVFALYKSFRYNASSQKF